MDPNDVAISTIRLQEAREVRLRVLGSDSDSDDPPGVAITPSEPIPANVAAFMAVRESYIASCASMVNDLDDAAAGIVIPVTLQDVEAKIANIDPRWIAKPDAWVVAEDGKLDLSDDPMAAVAINDEHRYATVPDGKSSDLWTVNQWHSAGPRVYKFNVPTFAPSRWGVSHTIDQTMYKSNFFQEFPEISRILPMANVAVCGGAAAYPLGEQSKKPGDVDFFLYGLPAGDDESSRRIRWGCVTALVNRIRDQFASCIEMISSGVITIKGMRKYERGARDQPLPVKCQIILRAYPTVSSILHGFDVPSCCVAYDGHVAVMTTMAAFAHMFRANIVVPTYRSTTYESRLIKYFERGFALVMPHLNVKMLAVGSSMELPNLIITPTLIKGRFITGSLALTEKQPPSDYTPIGCISRRRYYPGGWREHAIARNGERYINLKMLASDRPFVKLASLEDNHYRNRRRDSDDDAGIPFETFVTEPKKSDVFPKAELEKILKRSVKAAVSKTGMVNAANLKNIFSLQTEQILKLAQAVSEIHDRESRIDVSRSLEPFCNALLARWDARPEEINWWILADPSRQHTSSLNPRCEDPRSWYGSAFVDGMAPPTTDETLETMIGVYEQRSTVLSTGGIFDGQCIICHEDIHSGDKNSVTLNCGHVFHVTSTESCGGLCIWAIDGNRSCPTCRADFGCRQPDAAVQNITVSIQL